MKILLTGGGTGGHIVPLLAVARELRRLEPSAKLIYIGERSGKFQHLTRNNRVFNRTLYIFAGKFRRYHGESWLRRLTDVKTILLNTRDFFLVLIGICQAIWQLKRIKPDVVFIKGGFVGLPVGLAARLLRIPYITHDSDTVPGLANRLIGGKAALHATGLPAEFYNYPKDKVKFVGVPLALDFKQVSPKLKNSYREELKIPTNAKVILITGGSQGARNMNQLVAKAVPVTLDKHSDLFVIHQVGKGNTGVYGFYKNNRLTVKEFISDMHTYSGAADIIITRGGANSIAEYAVQHKPIIIIPHPALTGGHQLKNAEHLESLGAALVLQEAALEKAPIKLVEAIELLLASSSKCHELADNLGELAKPTAAADLAELVLGLGKTA